MAVTVDWLTYEIEIPKSDLVVVTPSPEVYSMDLSWLFDQLVPMMDDENDMSQEDKFVNTAPKVIGATNRGRELLILAPYTITFEAGNYAVNILDGTSNINDVATVNGVSIRSQGISVVGGSGSTPADVVAALVDSSATDPANNKPGSLGERWGRTELGSGIGASRRVIVEEQPVPAP